MAGALAAPNCATFDDWPVRRIASRMSGSSSSFATCKRPCTTLSSRSSSRCGDGLSCTNNGPLSRSAAASRSIRAPDIGWVLRAGHSNGATMLK